MAWTLSGAYPVQPVGNPPSQHGGEQDHIGRRGQPEGERLEAGERHPLGPDHQRQQVLAERPEHDRRHHHHHHRAVLAHHHQVRAGVHDVVGRRQQLGPDGHREQATGAEVDDHPDQVLEADHLVVQREPEVPGQPARRLFLLLGYWHRLADHLPEQVVEHAEAAQPADGAEHVAEHEREVVHVGQRVPGVAVGQHVAEPVPEEVADDGADEAGVEGRPHPPRPGRAGGGRPSARGLLRLLRLYLDGHPVTSSSQCRPRGLCRRSRRHRVLRWVVVASRAGDPADLGQRHAELRDDRRVVDQRVGRQRAQQA